MSLSRKQSRYPLLLIGVAGAVLPAMRAGADVPPSAPAGPPAVEGPAAPAWLRRVFRDEDWNVDFQSTYIWQKHPGFPAAYDGPHSLVHTPETGYTLTATLSLGYRPWRGGEIFFNPEIIQSQEFSHLHGLGGLTNGENQKAGGPLPTIYSARAFLRQTFDVGGETAPVAAGPNQFAGPVSARRFVLTVGQMAVIDVFDNNAYAHDSRTQFINWSLFTHTASDYAADARGYTWGLALEYYHDAWAFRWGHFAQPRESNGLAIDFRLWAHFGENVEVEHDHRLWGRPGKLRLMGIWNYARMAAFDDALAYAAQHGGVPDLANVRHDQSKLGLGVALEQALTCDLGLFARAGFNDGRTETYALAEVDRTLALGLSLRGRLWYRPGDVVAAAFAQNGISPAHRRFLAAGGRGNFIGDGQLPHPTLERILEVYYALAAFKSLWVTGDYQFIANPAYNPDRGPVSVFTIRFHVEL
jgi:hypothetical protein